MADPSRFGDDKPDTGRRWRKAIVIILVVVVLLAIVMLVVGGGHVPQQH